MSGTIHKDGTPSTLQDGNVEMYCPTCETSYASGFQLCPRDNTKLIRLVESGDPLLGTLLDDRYLLDKQLGSGGMGVVYRGIDTQSDGQQVALKIINPNKASDKEVSKRFLREAKILRQLGQTNTVNVLGYGQDPSGMLYLVMELLEGRHLGELLTEAGPLDPVRVRDIGMQLCGALDAAHGRGIIHRDLKPGNIIAVRHPFGGDKVKVLDFGIAKSLYGNSTQITESNIIVGTPGYLAPETALGKDPEPATDLYSLGVILYELLSGRLPFQASNATAMLRQHVSAKPPPLPGNVPIKLRRVVMSLLAKEPEARPATAGLVRRQLELSIGPGDDMAPTLLAGSDAPTEKIFSAEQHAATEMRTPLPAPHSGNRRSSFKVIGVVAVIGVLAGGLLIALDAMRSKSTTAPVAPATPERALAPAPPKQIPPAGTIGNTPAPAKPVLFKLATTPRGASVTLVRPGRPDFVLCTATPCDLAFPAESGAAELVFRRDGYQEVTIPVDLEPGNLTRQVALEKAPPPQRGEGARGWDGTKAAPDEKRPDTRRSGTRHTNQGKGKRKKDEPAVGGDFLAPP